MLQNKMSRKEFLTVVFSFFGLLFLPRLPGVAKLALPMRTQVGVYGNDSYGGTPKK